MLWKKCPDNCIYEGQEIACFKTYLKGNTLVTYECKCVCKKGKICRRRLRPSCRNADCAVSAIHGKLEIKLGSKLEIGFKKEW